MIERPLKRHGSDSSQTTSSPECSLSPHFSESIPSSSSDDEKYKTAHAINNRTYIISKNNNNYNNPIGDGIVSKVGECSKATSNLRDSQTIVYSSSSKISNKEGESSPAESAISSPQGTASEVSDFDAVPSLDVDDIVSDDYSVFSPLESDDRTLALASKNEKTPHASKKRTSSLYYKTQVENKAPCYVTPSSELRVCPLPNLTWADREKVWTSMVRKDEQASTERDVNMFDSHPGLQPRMRAILLDWLIEVCEVYKLHRETYYLTIDYLDRYITKKNNISKSQLQLIGITCLFIASKVRTYYFAYSTKN